MSDRAPSSSRIYIKNLPSSLSLQDFRKHFAQQALVTDAKFIPHRRIGYVGYKTDEDAEKAVTYYDKSFLGMARMRVEIARPFSETTDYPKKRRRIGDSPNQTHDPERTVHSVARVHDGAKHFGSASKGESDSAMLEYIQVMSQPNKDLRQGIEGNDLDKVQSDTSRELDHTAPAEYRISSSTGQGDVQTQDGPSRHVMPRPPVHDPSEDVLAEQLESEANEVAGMLAAAPHGVASDADWMRSRTSRLLGLIDEDEATERARPEDRDVSPGLASHTKPVSLHSEQTETVDPVRIEESPSTALHEKDHNRMPQPLAVGDRLFLRNLTFSLTANDLHEYFVRLGHGSPIEVNLPLDSRSGQNKGFAHVAFENADTAEKVLKDSDQSLLQGRILHVLPGLAKKNVDLDDFGTSGLPLKTQQHVRRRKTAGSTTFNWNSLFMNADAVVSSVADRLGVSKSDLLNPSSSDAAVKQALAETHTIQETKKYFMSQGVNLDALRSKERGALSILIKNFPYGTKVEELQSLIEQHAPVARIMMPPSGTIAIAEFGQEDHTKAVFSRLAYRKFKDSLLYLEKGPKGLLSSGSTSDRPDESGIKLSETRDLAENSNPSDDFETSTLFVSNLSFSTTGQRLHDTFASIDGFRSARVKTKLDPKKPGQVLSMGFGFLEFESNPKAEAALGAVNGYSLDGHDLLVRASHRSLDAQNRQKANSIRKAKNASTKIIIKNLPFEVSKKDIRQLFGAYGKLQSVRLPRKFDNSTRGFAFANFTSTREAENAVSALGDTHLLGRRLVLEVAAEDDLDPEAEIEARQKKAGQQNDKVALQKLTGAGRHRFVVEGAEDHVDRDS